MSSKKKRRIVEDGGAASARARDSAGDLDSDAAMDVTLGEDDLAAARATADTTGPAHPILTAGLPSILLGPVMKLSVGSEKTEFHVHRTAVGKIPFLKTAFDGDFKESVTGVVELPEDEPAVVSMLLAYTYERKTSAKFEGTPLEVATNWVKVKVLAEKWGDIGAEAWAERSALDGRFSNSRERFTF